MAALKTKTCKPLVDIQVVSLTCPCGGVCINDRGSYMLEEHDLTATCEGCGEKFPLLKKYFQVKTKEAEATAMIALIGEHMQQYQTEMDKALLAIRESYAEGQTNVDWARAKIATFKAKKEALDRILAVIGH